MTSRAASEAIEWNADVYHDVSNPHVTWGTRILSQLELEGDETAVDLGCGTGRLTAELLERLPTGHVVAVDRSRNMLDVAKTSLDPRFKGQVSYVQADLQEFEAAEVSPPVDLVFSTATFHWIHDHDQLFCQLFELLKPDGLLIAQCGGGPNIARLLERTSSIMSSEPFAVHFDGWSGPWYFADAETTARRLEGSGFVDVETNVIEAPVVMEDPDELRAFLTTVIFGEHLARIPDESGKLKFIDQHMTWLQAQPGAPMLDYWRLNMKAVRP